MTKFDYLWVDLLDMNILQKPEEYLALLEFLDERLFFMDKCLEIGCNSGATAYGFAKLFKKVITFESDWHPAWTRTWAKLQSDNKNVEIFPLDSHTEQAEQEIKSNAPYDLIFIDGDHSYEGVKKDLQLAKKYINPVGYIVFHDVENEIDINSESKIEVKRLWDEIDCYKLGLCATKRDLTYSISDTIEGFGDYSKWGGYGIIRGDGDYL